MGLNDELEKTRNAIRIISGTERGSVDAAVDYLEDLCRRAQVRERVAVPLIVDLPGHVYRLLLHHAADSKLTPGEGAAQLIERGLPMPMAGQ